MLEIANGGIDVAFKSIGSEMYNESISTYIGLNIRYLSSKANPLPAIEHGAQVSCIVNKRFFLAFENSATAAFSDVPALARFVNT